MFSDKEKLFGFSYDGAPAELVKAKEYEENGWQKNEYTVGNLTVVNCFRRVGKAFEWVNWFENRSKCDTKIISEIRDCDILLPLEKDVLPELGAFIADGECTLVYSPKGSDWTEDEFTCDVESYGTSTRKLASMFPGGRKYFSAAGGRSSQKFLPMFDINQGGRGYIIAVGWTGQWYCEMSRGGDGMNVKSGIEELAFLLHPGEKIRTSSFVLMPYSEGFTKAHNDWRRLIKDNYSILGKGQRDAHAPLAVNLWGGMESKDLVRRAELVGEKNMGFEYFWIDAGWHGHSTQDSPNEFEGDWSENVGSWNVNPYNHPDGLKEVANAIRENGMKFLLWFEPERVRMGADLEKEHPGFLLKNGNDGNLLLYLGNEKAWQWCFDMISNTVKALDVKCYRQDFNFDPLPYWRAADEENRKGIHEIKHIMGLYRLWEALLEEFPDLIIDNCASGGRRIDIETLRRSVPLWRSDYQCPANHDVAAAQCHTAALSSWIPYHGTSVGRIVDTYRFRSCYTTALGDNFIYSATESIDEIPQEMFDFIRKMNAEYKKVREIMECDYYPLTAPSADKNCWCAMQFDSPEKGEGIILVYRREKSPYSSASFSLGNISSEHRYSFTDADTGEEQIIDGAELKKNGFNVVMKSQRTARLIYIKKI